MSELKTFNRGKLKRLCEQGKLTMIEGYHYDETFGESRPKQEMPVAMRPAKIEDRKEGICYMMEHDFKSKSGCAYESGTHAATGEKLVTLIVHSNCSYVFRIKS